MRELPIGHKKKVVDVEYYGDKRRRKKELDRETITRELDVLLCALEEEYHAKPILYTTYPAYHDLIEGSFDEYDLWIRNVFAGGRAEFSEMVLPDRSALE